MFLQKIDSLSTSDNTIDVTAQVDPIYEKITTNEQQILVHKSAINSTDIGSFKFIADAFDVEIEQAVKWFIILIVVVFDPLAICLVIGYNMYVVTQQLNEKMAKIPPREPVPTRMNNKNKRVIVLGRNKS